MVGFASIACLEILDFNHLCDGMFDGGDTENMAVYYNYHVMPFSLGDWFFGPPPTLVVSCIAVLALPSYPSF